MTATYTEARDETMSRLNTQWTASGAFTETTPLLFEDKEEADSAIPVGDEPWARAGIRFLPAAQVAHGDGEKLYRRPGLLMVDVYTPPGDGKQSVDAIVEVLTSAFEGHSTPGGVTFLTFEQNDRGMEDGEQLTRVIATFEFYERK